MKPDRVWRAVAVGVVAWGLAGNAARAQDYNEPPADVPMASDPQSETGALALRISRLEEKLRSANGQIEELQNQNRKLAEDLRRFREDVEFRLQGKSGQAGPLPAPAPSDIAALPPKPSRKDAFDPDADPNAPGAPKPLGQTAPSAPLNLPSHLQRDETAGFKPLPTPVPTPAKPDEGEPSFVASSVPFSDSKEQFKSAVAAYKAGQYADAEALFKAWLDANKGAANAPDAIFYIGETYMQRGRPREAAEQYLKVSTDFPKSARAPESMVRLGLALAKLGNNDQACATFAEVGKRYPSASAKRSADREAKAQRCT